MSQKTYLIRVIGGGAMFFIVSTIIMAFFFSLGRGHILNFHDLLPWIAAGLISCISTFFWFKRNTRELRVRRNLWGPDHPDP